MDQQPQYPSSSPAGPTPPAYSPPTMAPPPEPPKKNRTRLLILSVLLVLIIAGAVVYAYDQHDKNKNTDIGGSASLNGSAATSSTCTPIIATTLDTTSLDTTYQRFATAVATKNQTCANGLSTSYFLNLQKQTFSTQNWITATVDGHESLADDFSQLPANLDTTKFTQTDYTQAVIAGSSDQTPATGETLSYPIDLSKYEGASGQKMQASISMVLDNDYVKVDNLVIESQAQ